MIEKDGMHHLPHIFIAAERKREVAYSSAHLGVGQVLLDPPDGFDKIYRVILMRINSRGNRQHIGVEDNIFRVKSIFSQQLIGTITDLDAAIECGGLSRLIESHYHHCRTVALRQPSMRKKFRLPVLQRNGIDNRFSLYTFQAGLYHLPLRRVNHNGHSRHIGIGCQQVQEIGHLFHPIEQSIIHIDIDGLSTILYLLAGNIKRLFIVLLLDQPQEPPRTGYVAPLPDIHKIDLG